MVKQQGVSVIICCYNSASRITETLKHLCKQKTGDSIPWEVIVINNASSDDTVSVAQSAWEKNLGSTNFKIVDQPIPGLSSARNKGIEVSAYEILIFCDDDNHFDSDYVAISFELMNKHQDVGIIGGWIKPRLLANPGDWIDDFYSALAIGKQAEDNGYVDWVFGAGMVFRKKIFRELKSRNIKLLLSDRIGKKQSSGGDAEMCQLTRFIGYKIYFSRQLVLHHQIEGNRLTKKSFIRSNLENFHATIHLYILENLIQGSDSSLATLVFSFIIKRTLRIVHAIPRLVFGKRLFLNFLEVYVNMVFIVWIFTHVPEIKKSFDDIKETLYDGQKGR